MAAYYNEIDPYAAQWLRRLIAAGHIAAGDVDERDIRDVRPDDLRGYRQCHFFAGIGVWSHALRLAGWDDDREVWTGSCPCQPFSAAGRGEGFADERHLWPAWFWLIGQCKPAVVFGEQVAAKAADAWIDLVQHDLEGLGYRVGAVPIPAAGVGAPHIRDRMWWVADAELPAQARQRQHGGQSIRFEEAEGLAGGSGAGELAYAANGRCHDGRDQQPRGQREAMLGAACGDAAGRLADADGRDEPHQREGANRPTNIGAAARRAELRIGADRRDSRLAHPRSARLEGRHDREVGRQRPAAERGGRAGGVADAQRAGWQRGRTGQAGDARREEAQPAAGGPCDAGDGAEPGPLHGFWRDADWLLCRDGKWRPVEPGTFPLAHGAAARVGRLRAYGNAIVAPLAAEFIRAYTDVARPDVGLSVMADPVDLL